MNAIVAAHIMTCRTSLKMCEVSSAGASATSCSCSAPFSAAFCQTMISLASSVPRDIAANTCGTPPISAAYAFLGQKIMETNEVLTVIACTLSFPAFSLSTMCPLLRSKTYTTPWSLPLRMTLQSSAKVTCRGLGVFFAVTG
jgi:hypothetical protein